MTDSFPRQQARTQGFSLGVPRSFQISPDGSRVAFLRSQGGDDPVTCLWVIDAGTGQERLVADPAKAGSRGRGHDRRRAGHPGTDARAGGGHHRIRHRRRAHGGRVRPGRPGLPGGPDGGRLPAGDPGPGSRVRPPSRPGRAAGRLRLRGRAAGHRPGDRRGHRDHRAGRGAGAQLRARRVHRGRGDGPHPGLLVGARRHGPARGQGGQHPRPAAGTSPTRRTRPGPPPRSPTRRRAPRTPT